jgi:hypothetical protein
MMAVYILAAIASAQTYDDAGNPLSGGGGGGTEVAGSLISSIVHPIAGSKHTDLDGWVGQLLAISAYDGLSVIYHVDWYSGATLSTVPADDTDSGVGFDTLRWVYVTTRSSATPSLNQIKVYDGFTPTPLLILPAPFPGALGVAYDPNRDVYWVTCWTNNMLASVNPTTGQLITSYSTAAFGCTRPAGTAYDAANDQIAIGGRDQNAVFIVDAATGVLVTSFPAPDGTNNPQGAGAFIDGAGLWLSSWNSPTLFQVDNGHSLNVALNLSVPGFVSLTITNIPPGADCRLFFDVLPSPYAGTGPFAGATLSPGQIAFTLGWPLGVIPFSTLGPAGSVTYGPLAVPSGIHLNVCVVDFVAGALTPPLRADGGTVP